VQAFAAVGASRPVTLTAEGKGTLLGVVAEWLDEATVDGLPPGVFELRNALVDERGWEEIA
jgi:hypothetical protein